jgi:(E)-4-hydroxy-3-methylbut-2-enyl-diphosphate synthase
MKRTKTRPVYIDGLQLGGINRVLIQTMTTFKTSKTDQVIEQIKQITKLGADLVRVSVVDLDDALAIKTIKANVDIPIVADIHFDYRLALSAIENGASKIRINPGNIGDKEKVKLIVEACKINRLPIRIGVNAGSLDKSLLKTNQSIPALLVESAKRHVKILEDLDFNDIVVSLKGSNVLDTIAAYRQASKIFAYPLHLGITEAGIKDIGIVRSVAGLAPLLVEGIGDTIRISLTGDPKEEVIACKRLLHDLGLYPNYPTLISCPTCGRAQVDVLTMANEISSYLEMVNKPIKVAVMGCIVNGPGESKQADIGIAGGKNHWVIFKKGQVVKTVTSVEAVKQLKKEIDNY